MNIQPIIDKVHAVPNVLDMTLDLKTFILAMVATIGGLFAFGDNIAFIKNGDDAVAGIKSQLSIMQKTIIDEHKEMRIEIEAFKQFEDVRHSTESDHRAEMAIRLSNSETVNQFVQKDMDHMVRSVDLLHEKIDRYMYSNGNGVHPAP